MDALKAHAMALDAIDALTQSPEIKRLLKPLKESEQLKVYHYVCPVCGLNFWIDRRLDNIDCPQAKCGCKWLPHTMDGHYERGVEEWIENVNTKSLRIHR